MQPLKLNDDNLKQFETYMRQEMDSPIKHFEHELLAIRTGRAHASLVENIKVMCYGASEMPLKELASISTPEARLFVIQPWDKSVINDIEKAIQNADLGITPVNDGELIRIQLPQITTTRRDELIKILHQKLEDGRIGVRNVRKEFNNLVRDSLKAKDISEDHSRRLNDSLQKITDQFIATLEELSKKKESDLRGV